MVTESGKEAKCSSSPSKKAQSAASRTASAVKNKYSSIITTRRASGSGARTEAPEEATSSASEDEEETTGEDVVEPSRKGDAPLAEPTDEDNKSEVGEKKSSTPAKDGIKDKISDTAGDKDSKDTVAAKDAADGPKEAEKSSVFTPASSELDSAKLNLNSKSLEVTEIPTQKSNKENIAERLESKLKQITEASVEETADKESSDVKKASQPETSDSEEQKEVTKTSNANEADASKADKTEEVSAKDNTDSVAEETVVPEKDSVEISETGSTSSSAPQEPKKNTFLSNLVESCKAKLGLGAKVFLVLDFIVILLPLFIKLKLSPSLFYVKKVLCKWTS